MYLKKHKKSLELYEQAYRSLCKTLGEEHPHTLTVLSNLSVLYLEMGKPQEALETGMKAYQILCAKLGEDHPATLVAMQNVAEATRRLGNYKESISLQKKILTKRRQKLGAVHAKTVTSFVNLIATYILLPFSPLVRLWKNVVGSDNTAAPNADTAASTQAENSQQATDFETSPDTNPIGNLASDQVLKYKRWMKSPWALLISLVSITCLNTALLAAITVFAADSTGARFFMGFVKDFSANPIQPFGHPHLQKPCFRRRPGCEPSYRRNGTHRFPFPLRWQEFPGGRHQTAPAHP